MKQRRTLAFAPFLLVAAATAIQAQSTAPGRGNFAASEGPECAAFGPLRPLSQNVFEDYSLTRISRDSAETLKQMLHQKCWEHALQTYFPSRDSRHVDWVVYLGPDGAQQAVTLGLNRRNTFRGQKYIWAVVFTDGPMCAHLPGDTVPDLIFSRRSVDYQRDRLLTGLVKAVAGKLFAAPADDGASVLSDSTLGLNYEPLTATETPADTSVGTVLCATQGRFGVSENTEVVLSLRGGRGKPLPGRTRSVYTNVGNASPSPWDVGLAAGSSFGRRIAAYNDAGTFTGYKSGTQPNIYLTTYYNLRNASLPWSPGTFSLMTGTNIGRGGMFDEVLVGVAGGRVISDAGIVVASDFRTEQYVRKGETTSRERRRPRLFVGMDVRF